MRSCLFATQRLAFAALLLTGSLGFAWSSRAADDDDDKPTFELALFGGLPGMYGDTDTDEGKSTVPIDTSDLTDEWNYAARAVARFQMADFSVQGGAEFMNLDSERELAFVRVGPHGNPTTQESVRPEAELWIGDLNLGYRLFHAEDTVLEPSAELYAGARYYDYSPDISITGAGSIDESDSWFDGIVGARINLALSDTVNMMIEGDVGGFGLWSSSEFQWMQMTSLGWSFTDYTRLYLAYKFQQFRRDDGDTNYNQQFRGPYAGLSVVF